MGSFEGLLNVLQLPMLPIGNPGKGLPGVPLREYRDIRKTIFKDLLSIVFMISFVFLVFSFVFPSFSLPFGNLGSLTSLRNQLGTQGAILRLS